MGKLEVNRAYLQGPQIPRTDVHVTDAQSPIMEVDVVGLFDQFMGDNDVISPVLIETVEHAIRSLEQCVRGYDADLKGSERLHERLQFKHEAAKKENIDLQGKNEQLSKDNNEILNKVFAVQEFNGTVMDEKKVLEREVDDLKRTVTRLKSEARAYEAEKSQVGAYGAQQATELDEANEKVQDLTEHLQEVQAVNSALQKENDYLSARVNDYVDNGDGMSFPQIAGLLKAWDEA